MAKMIGPKKPFLGYESQYAYRKAKALAAGFPSRAARAKAVAAQNKVLAKSSLPPAKRKELAGGLADLIQQSKGAPLGSFNLGETEDQRGSKKLPPRLRELIDEMGDDAYPIWRTLYE